MPNLEFLNGVETYVADNARAATSFTVVSLIVGITLDHEVVPHARHPSEAQQPEGRIASDARRKQGELIIAATVEWQILNLLTRNQARLFSLRGFDQWRSYNRRGLLY